MNPQDSPDPLTPNPAPPEIHNPLSTMQPGEQIICEIKRHPIGILGAYIISGALILALAIVAFVVAPNVFADNRSQVMALGGIAFLVVGGLLVGFVFVANKVYWGNRWVVTNDSITEIVQTSLFHKQSSQLSLGNLEDVTVEQNGVLPQLFKYGVLKAETAGESSKFVFLFCPDPSYYARKVLAAREDFEQRRRAAGQQNSQQRLYRDEGAYQPPPEQPQPPIPQQPPAPPQPPNY